MSEKKLGERLREQREALGLSIKNVAQELQTSQKFVKALEEGNYKELTAKVYARGFMERMFNVLGLTDDRASLFFQFEKEWESFTDMQRATFSYTSPSSMRGGFSITPAKIRTAAIVASLILFLSFLGARLLGFLHTPALVIQEPYDREVRKNDPVMKVSGKGEKESQLTMNGRELRMSEQGDFSDTIEMLPGLNTLEFVLENRFGKLTRETRYVLVE